MNPKFPRNRPLAPGPLHQVSFPNPFAQQQDDGGREPGARYGDARRKKRKFPNWLGVAVVHKKKHSVR